MTDSSITVAVAGTHSTGKSTLINSIEARLHGQFGEIGTIKDLAKSARELGFPILTQHTYESTLWIMAEGLRQEAELRLNKEVILIDRPIFDALGYFEAALEVTRRKSGRLAELRDMARAHTGSYDLVVVTVLDPGIPLGEGRDENSKFREAAAKHVERLANQYAPNALRMTSENQGRIVTQIVDFLLAKSGKRV